MENRIIQAKFSELIVLFLPKYNINTNQKFSFEIFRDHFNFENLGWIYRIYFLSGFTPLNICKKQSNQSKKKVTTIKTFSFNQIYLFTAIVFFWKFQKRISMNVFNFRISRLNLKNLFSEWLFALKYYLEESQFKCLNGGHVRVRFFNSDLFVHNNNFLLEISKPHF